VFRWKAGPGTITSVLRLVDRPRALGWTGRTFGIDAIHVWRFEPRGPTTIASMEESFDGLVAKLFRRRLQRQLDATTKSGLEGSLLVSEDRPAQNATRTGGSVHGLGEPLGLSQRQPIALSSLSPAGSGRAWRLRGCQSDVCPVFAY
jgi:hypothetical protein